MAKRFHIGRKKNSRKNRKIARPMKLITICQVTQRLAASPRVRLPEAACVSRQISLSVFMLMLPPFVLRQHLATAVPGRRLEEASGALLTQRGVRLPCRG